VLKAASLLGLAASFCALFWLFLRGALVAEGAAGLSVQALALALMVWARLTLGRRSFRPAPAPADGGLVTGGPYKYLRHPIYAAALYLTWAGALTHPAAYNFILALVPVAGLGLRLLAEEKLLLGKYPDYAAYAARTARVVPFLL
jgi:protein-S-isoprenylcysteine O-methyltransferase Ste14